MSENKPSETFKKVLKQFDYYKLATQIKEQTGLRINTKSFSSEQKKLTRKLLAEWEKTSKVFSDEQKFKIENFVKDSLKNNPTTENLTNSIKELENVTEAKILGKLDASKEEIDRIDAHFKDLLQDYKADPEHEKSDALYEMQIAKAALLSRNQNIPGLKTDKELRQELDDIRRKNDEYINAELVQTQISKSPGFAKPPSPKRSKKPPVKQIKF